MKMKVKAKADKHPTHGFRSAHINFGDNGGSSVRMEKKPTGGNPFPTGPDEENHFGSVEEGLHHIGKQVGSDVVLGDPDADAAEDMAKKGAGTGHG